MATREQERASFALAKVKPLAGDDRRRKYKTQLLKLPARLHGNGLGQTLAFNLAQGSDSPEGKICDWLTAWLNQIAIYREPLTTPQFFTGDGVENPEVLYRAAATESRALALWLKRFAEAYLAGDPE